MEERLLWTGKTSHIYYFTTYTFMICVVLLIQFMLHGYYRYLMAIPAFWNVWNYLTIEFSSIVITNHRIVIRHGIFNRYLEEIELFRVKDISMFQPFLYRMNNCANILLITSDKSDAHFLLKAIPEAERLKDLIRSAAVEQRKINGVKEIDIFN